MLATRTAPSPITTWTVPLCFEVAVYIPQLFVLAVPMQLGPFGGTTVLNMFADVLAIGHWKPGHELQQVFGFPFVTCAGLTKTDPFAKEAHDK